MLAVGIVTAVAWLPMVSALALTAPWPRARRKIQYFTFKHWSRSLCRVLGIRIEVTGTAPQGACLLVSNHLSYVDILVIATRVPCRFVAKAEVRDWPIAGWICRSVDTLFVDRRSRRDAHRVVQEIRESVAAGDIIAVFPEGTSTHGHEVAPFRAPLLAAAEDGVPIHYAAISYRTPDGHPPAHLAVCWWGEMPFGSHARALLELSEISATLRFGYEPVAGSDRKALAVQLHQEVTRLFDPVVAFVPDDPSAI